MQYGCIAEHLGHSFSKKIHALLGDCSYELLELTPEELDGFLRKRDFRGINVTIPYKKSVLPYLDEADESVRRIGAANTLVNRDGKLYGYNTDFYGMCALLSHLGLDLKGKKVAILGTGGTSRTAFAVAEHLQAGRILLVSRTQKEDACSYETLVHEHADVQILINTTPVGMYPHLEGIPVDPDCFPRLEGVVDAVYNPLRSRLVLQAKKRGIPAEGGLWMLVAQGVRASEHFLNTTYPQDTVGRVYSEVLRQTQNIVLIGMPGSGKSTVGACLAGTLGREFFDSDELIVARAGKSIPQIFAEDGEAAFRDLESKVIRELLAAKSGAVIATGGGAVLREENVDALRQNGRIYFLDRPLKDLTATSDRPLASDRAAIEARYAERYARYCQCADVRVDGSGSIEAVADRIEKEFVSTL
ncbi:MAG: shikimate dehydrogenase [Clostridia bacterium]|nr:shikimate dehydrogenase [Clostridia bacterium]